MNPGKGNPPVPLTPDSKIVSLPQCPDCDGRGWFLINPFATNGGGFGGIMNMTQCLTCQSSEIYWRTHGTLPPDLVTRIERKSSRSVSEAKHHA